MITTVVGGARFGLLQALLCFLQRGEHTTLLASAHCLTAYPAITGYCFVSSGCLASSKNWFCSFRLSSSALMALSASAI